MGCRECRKPCPEHGVTACATCHNHPGECGYGGCTRRAAHRFEFAENGRVYEVREFCRKHGTAAHYGWLRAGGTEVEGPREIEAEVMAAAERFAPEIVVAAGGRA